MRKVSAFMGFIALVGMFSVSAPGTAVAAATCAWSSVKISSRRLTPRTRTPSHSTRYRQLRRPMPGPLCHLARLAARTLTPLAYRFEGRVVEDGAHHQRLRRLSNDVVRSIAEDVWMVGGIQTTLPSRHPSSSTGTAYRCSSFQPASDCHWSGMEQPRSCQEPCRDRRHLLPDDIWAVGTQGVIERRDGSTWPSLRMFSFRELYDIKAISANDICGGVVDPRFLVRMLHYDGAS